jgi:hypothetical protein
MDFSKCVSNICLTQFWNVDDREPIYEIRDEDISIQSKQNKTRITYTFPIPINVNYLGNQAIYKTLTFDAKIINIPRKFVMVFSNILRYAGIPTISSDKEEHINSKKLLQDIKLGKTVCLTDYPSVKSMNMTNVLLRHNYIKKEEELEETFNRIKCSPETRDKIIDKYYETEPEKDLTIVMVIGLQEFMILDTTFEKNIQSMNRLIRNFNYPHQHRAIRKFYNNIVVDKIFSFKDLSKYSIRDAIAKEYIKKPRLFMTSSSEIVDLLDVLFPFGANLNWYDTSCNSISGLNLFPSIESHLDESLALKVPNSLHKRYISIVRNSLEIINNGLNKIPGLGFGNKRKSKRKSNFNNIVNTKRLY